ncbi:MAG: TSUP family transporter [Streptosporangiaceae bacterium]
MPGWNIADVFEVVAAAVPASPALIQGERVLSWRELDRQDSRLLLASGLIAVSAYDGYWCTGAGVMTLAVVMITTGQQLVRSNALKNMLLGVADVTCCVVFVMVWPVEWAAAVPMAVGVLVGSMTGPLLTRHVPGGAVRITAALAGLGLAIYLWAGR